MSNTRSRTKTLKDVVTPMEFFDLRGQNDAMQNLPFEIVSSSHDRISEQDFDEKSSSVKTEENAFEKSESESSSLSSSLSQKLDSKSKPTVLAKKNTRQTLSGIRRFTTMAIPFDLKKDETSIDNIQKFYSTDYILAKLNRERLDYISLQFLNAPRQGFNKIDFMQMMKNIIPYWPHQKNDNITLKMHEFCLYHGLHALFKEIDINEDGFLEWEEFSTYIVDVVGFEDLNQQVKNEDEFFDQLRSQNQQPINLLKLAQSQKIQNFQLSFTHQDNINHNSSVEKMVHYKKSDIVIVQELGQRSLSLSYAYSEHNRLNEPFSICKLGKITPIMPKKQFIVSFACNEQEGTIAVTTTQGLIFFYQNIFERGAFYYRLFKIICACNNVCQVRIWYAPEHNLWFTVGYNNMLLSWYVTKVKAHSRQSLICDSCQKTLFKTGVALFGDHFLDSQVRVEKAAVKNDHSYLKDFKFQHPDQIMDLVEVKIPFVGIVTACLDGNIRAFRNSRLLWTMRGSERTGVRFVDFTECYGGALLSVGFESTIKVWNIKNSQSFNQVTECDQKLTMGIHPVACAKFLGNSFFLVSIDVKGQIRIWNYKTGQLNQILNPPVKLKSQVNGIVVFSEIRFAVLTRRISFFNTPVIPQIIQSQDYKFQIKESFPVLRGLGDYQAALIQPAIDCWFCEVYQTFLVVSKNCLRVYGAKDGQLQKYFDFAGQEITCMLLNQVDRKLFLGNSSGLIRVYNSSTIIQTDEIDLAPQKLQDQNNLQEIAGILSFKSTSKTEEMILTAQWSDHLNVFNCKNLKLIKESQGITKDLKDEIRCIALSDHHSLVGTGSSQGKVQLWDFEMLKLIAVLKQQSDIITSICFAEEYPLMFSTSIDGTICAYSIRGGFDRNQTRFLAKFVNLQINQQHQYIPVGVSCSTTKIINDNVVFQTELSGKIKTQSPENIEFFLQDEKKVEVLSAKNCQKYIPIDKKKFDQLIMVYGDENGYLSWIDLSIFINDGSPHLAISASSNIEGDIPFVTKSKPYSQVKIGYVADRDIKQQAIKATYQKLAENSKVTNPQPPIAVQMSILCRKFKAHNGVISSIRQILVEPYGFTTTSEDKKIRIWDFFGKSKGSINLLSTDDEHLKNWKFDYDFQKAKLEQSEEVNRLVKQIKQRSMFADFDDDKPVNILAHAPTQHLIEDIVMQIQRQPTKDTIQSIEQSFPVPGAKSQATLQESQEKTEVVQSESGQKSKSQKSPGRKSTAGSQTSRVGQLSRRATLNDLQTKSQIELQELQQKTEFKRRATMNILHNSIKSLQTYQAKLEKDKTEKYRMQIEKVNLELKRLKEMCDSNQIAIEKFLNLKQQAEGDEDSTLQMSPQLKQKESRFKRKEVVGTKSQTFLDKLSHIREFNKKKSQKKLLSVDIATAPGSSVRQMQASMQSLNSQRYSQSNLSAQVKNNLLQKVVQIKSRGETERMQILKSQQFKKVQKFTVNSHNTEIKSTMPQPQILRSSNFNLPMLTERAKVEVKQQSRVLTVSRSLPVLPKRNQ